MNGNIQRIMCCCGNGVGTSLLMQMTIEEALELLGVWGIEVVFGALADIGGGRADLYVVSQELKEAYRELPVIGLEDLTDAEAAAELLRPLLERR